MGAVKAESDKTEKCAACGLGWVGQPQHIFRMAAFAGLARGREPDKKDYMRYGYRCANGHKWESSYLDTADST